MTTTPSTQPLPSTFTMEGVISITECPAICINSYYVLRPRDSILPLSFATTSQPSALYRLTSRHYATDLMAHSFLSNSRRLVLDWGERGGDEGRGESAVEMRPRKRTSPSCAQGFRLCSVCWKVVGAGVVIRLPPHLYKCGGTEGWNGTAKKLSR